MWIEVLKIDTFVVHSKVVHCSHPTILNDKAHLENIIMEKKKKKAEKLVLNLYKFIFY